MGASGTKSTTPPPASTPLTRQKPPCPRLSAAVGSWCPSTCPGLLRRSFSERGGSPPPRASKCLLHVRQHMHDEHR